MELHENLHEPAVGRSPLVRGQRGAEEEREALEVASCIDRH